MATRSWKRTGQAPYAHGNQGTKAIELLLSKKSKIREADDGEFLYKSTQLTKNFRPSSSRTRGGKGDKHYLSLSPSWSSHLPLSSSPLSLSVCGLTLSFPYLLFALSFCSPPSCLLILLEGLPYPGPHPRIPRSPGSAGIVRYISREWAAPGACQTVRDYLNRSLYLVSDNRRVSHSHPLLLITASPTLSLSRGPPQLEASPNAA